MTFEELEKVVPAKITHDGQDLFLKLTSNVDGTLKHVVYFALLEVKDTKTVLKVSKPTWTEAMQAMHDILKKEKLI